MFTDRPEFYKTTIILWATAFAMLILVDRVNFPFFHIIVELFSIVVASGIFIISWHSRSLHENVFLPSPVSPRWPWSSSIFSIPSPTKGWESSR